MALPSTADGGAAPSPHRLALYVYRRPGRESVLQVGKCLQGNKFCDAVRFDPQHSTYSTVCDAACFDPQQKTYSTVWPGHLCGWVLSMGDMAMTSRLCTAVAGCRCVVSTGHHQCPVVRSRPACTGLGRSSGSRRAQEQGRSSRSSDGCSGSGRRPQHAPAGAVWQQHGCVGVLALSQCSCPDISCSQVGASLFPSAHRHSAFFPDFDNPPHSTHKRTLLTVHPQTHQRWHAFFALGLSSPRTQAPVRSWQAQLPARPRQQGSRCASPTLIPACVQPRGVVLACSPRRARW